MPEFHKFARKMPEFNITAQKIFFWFSGEEGGHMLPLPPVSYTYVRRWYFSRVSLFTCNNLHIIQTETYDSRSAVSKQQQQHVQCQPSDLLIVLRLTFSSKIASIVLERLNSGADGSTLYSGLSYMALKRGSLMSIWNIITYTTNMFNVKHYKIQLIKCSNKWQMTYVSWSGGENLWWQN